MSGRWDAFLDYPAERPPGRWRKRAEAAPPPRSLREARQRHLWLWVKCGRAECTVLLAAPIVPLMIRWGPDMLLEVAARKWRCGRCGHVGVVFDEPSWHRADRRCVSEIHRWTGEALNGPRLDVGRTR